MKYSFDYLVMCAEKTTGCLSLKVLVSVILCKNLKTAKKNPLKVNKINIAHYLELVARKIDKIKAKLTFGMFTHFDQNFSCSNINVQAL